MPLADNNNVPMEGQVLPVDIPASSLPQQSLGETSFFEENPEAEVEANPNAPENLFSEETSITQDGGAPAYARPLAASILAIAMSDAEQSPAAQLSEQNLSTARDLIDRREDLNTRVAISLDRTQRESAVLRGMIDRARDGLDNPLSLETTTAVEQAYQVSIAADQASRARVSAELEAVERIQDNWTQGDDVEAFLTYQREFNDEQPFTAMENIRDDMARQLINAQLVENLEATYKDSSWPRYIVNLLTYIVPLRANFDVSGIADDAGIENDATSFMNFIFSGDNYQAQGEALAGLPLEEYARVMAVNGPLHRALQANSGLFLDDPGQAVYALQNLLYINEDSQNLENIFGVIDPLLLVPFGRLSKVGTTILKGGARRAAAERIADAAGAMAREGVDDVAVRTGTTLDEVIENMEPSLTNPQANGESLASDVMAHLDADRRVIAEGPEIFATTRFTNVEELANAVEATKTSILDEVGTGVRDMRVLEEDVITGTRTNWLNRLPENGNRTWSVEVTVGRKSGGGYATEQTARNGVGRVVGDRSDVLIYQSANDGQWYGKFRVNVKEEGFVTAKLDTPEVGPFGALFNFFRSSALNTDRVGSSRALVGDNGFLTWQRQTSKQMSRMLKNMNSETFSTTTEILKVSSNNNKWYSRAEFENLYNRGRGSLDDIDNGWAAYSAYRSYQNQAFIFRNGLAYRRLIGQGFETIEFEIGGRPFRFNGIVNEGDDIALNSEYFDITNKTTVRDLTPQRLEGIRNAGYVRIRLDEPFDAGNGNLVHNVIVRKDTLRRRPLDRDVLGYREGPSREYTGNYWVKQGREDAAGRLLRPDVFTTGNNPNQLKAWADTFNSALAAYRGGARSSVDFDAIFNGAKGFPTGQGFLDDIQAGRINPKHDVEVTFDRELPDMYTTRRDDTSRFMDPGETPQEMFDRTTGRMFYSRRGEHVTDWTGQLAETVDPWETMNRSLYNISRMTSLSGYKDHILERFMRTYEKHLELRNIDRTKSLYEVANAKVKPGVDSRLRRQIVAEQNAINRVLNFETGFEKTQRMYRREVAEWVLGGSTKDKGVRQALHNGLLNSSPLEFMRSFAFDLKLGLFNLGQFFIQTSTSLAAMAMSPRHGLYGAMMGFPMFMYRFAGKRGIGDNVLDVMSKNGIWKVGGFANEAEFKEFARISRDSGIWEVGGDNFSQIAQQGPNRVYGAVSAGQAILETGRAAFYWAEQVNRNVAARIAWGEAKEAGLRAGTAEFRDFFLRRTDDYSMNMMNASAAQFQKGVLSVPTQFWAYSFRMMDNMLNFGNKTFTAGQRARLIMSQFILAGTAGVPFLDVMKNYYERAAGEPLQINTPEGMLSRGLVDSLIYALTDADIQASEKIGTGSLIPNLIADIFGFGTYGEKSLGEWLAGPVGSISWAVGDTFSDVIAYSMAEAGSDGGFELTEESVLKLFQEVASISYATKAYLAHEYGIFRSKNTVSVSGLPESSAVFIAMGLQPTEIEESNYYRGLSEDRDQTVNDIVSQMRTWRQEAFNNPDKWEENMIKTNTLSRMIDPELRNEVLIQLNRTSDNSLNEFLAERYEQERAERELFEELTRENNE